MDNKIILVCDGTIDGIFTAIFDGFVIRNKRYGQRGEYYRDNIQICVEPDYNEELFAEYIPIDTDYEKSFKTAASIRKKLGEEVYMLVIRALCHYETDRATIVFGFLVRGFKAGSRVLEMLGDKYVICAMELSRKALNEAHLFKGFLRFKDIDSTLYGIISPKCDVIPLIGDHFDERYPNENWIIYDKKRKKAAIHKKYRQWIITANNEINGEYLEEIYEKADDYTHMWKTFYEALYTKERKNEKCQNNLIPKWYRKNMTEFQIRNKQHPEDGRI